jgi:hypothetical protein
LLGEIVQFCALASDARDAHFWPNKANKWLVSIASKNDEAKFRAWEVTRVTRILGWGRSGETGALEANVECESPLDVLVVCRVVPLGG